MLRNTFKYVIIPFVTLFTAIGVPFSILIINRDLVLPAGAEDTVAITAFDESAKAYTDELLAEAAKEIEYDYSTEERKKIKATGKVTIHTVLVKPSDLPQSSINGIVSSLKNPAKGVFEECDSTYCYKNVSLNYAETYMHTNAKKFGVKNLDFNVKLYDTVYNIVDLYKVGDVMNFWEKDMFGITKLQDAFEQVLTENNIPATENDLVIFLYFDNSNDTTGDPERFYDSKKFRSFAKEINRRAYVNVFDFNYYASQFFTEVYLHEALHLFGASDKYIEGQAACTEKGRGQPDKNPVFPQANGDIMCMFVEQQQGRFIRGSIVNNTLVINKITAKEIGWR